MTKSRLEAFSDGVIAIVITIMVLELKKPESTSLEALQGLMPVFLSYIMSFTFVGIYWNNHHHLFQAVRQVRGGVLWANLHLLFWLSLIPWATAWMGETNFARVPVAIYGVVLICCALAYSVVVRTLLRHHDRDSELARAIGNDLKGKMSLLIYAVAVGLAWWQPAVACALYAVVSLMWLVPDKRIERVLES